MHSSSPGARWRRALASSALLLAAACNPDEAPADRPAAAKARSVLLADGSRVEIRSRAQRVLPASSSVVDFLVALAPPERFAGLPEQALEYASLPGGASSGSPARQAWESVPRFSAFLAENVIALRPDLVLAEPWQARDTLARLESAGIESVVLPEVRGWEDARATLISVGELLALEQRAAELVGELDARVERLRSREGPRRNLRVLCYSNFGSSGWSAGEQTTIHAQIELAGMRNALAETGRTGHVQVSFEDLITLDPDLLLVMQPLRQGEGTQGDRGGASAELLRGEPSLRGLRAVRGERIVALPPRLFATASHELVSGAEFLATAIDELLRREAAAAAEKRD